MMFYGRNKPRPYRIKLVSEQQIGTTMPLCQIGRYMLQIRWLISRFDVSLAAAPDARGAQPVCLQCGGWIVSLHHPQPPVTANATTRTYLTKLETELLLLTMVLILWCGFDVLVAVSNAKVLRKIRVFGQNQQNGSDIKGLSNLRARQIAINNAQHR